MHSASRCFWVVLAVALGGVLGCGGMQTRIADPLATLPANEDSAAFLDRLSAQPNVSENDAFRGVLLLLNGQDSTETFRQRVETLLDGKLIAPEWGYEAFRPITRGKVAYMIYQACRLPGGVMLRLIGPTQRYCLRELQYRQMMTAGLPYTPVTGMEFIAVLSRADICIRTGKVPDMLGDVPDD